MAYSVYWEEEVHIRPRGEIVVGDDGEKKRVLYRRHFLKFNYIPISQIVCISSGDGELRIELKDGSEKCRLDYVKFGNMPMSRSKLEDCYHETSMELHPLGYYIVDEFVYVNDETAERLKYIEHTRYNNGYPKNIVDIINETQDLFSGCMMIEKVAYDIQNYISRELYNASNGEYALTDGVQVTFDTEKYVANCVVTDEAFKILADNNLL